MNNMRKIVSSLVLLAAVGCGGAQPAAAPSAPAAKVDPAEGLAKIARWRAWEPKQLQGRKIQFADLGMIAEVESAAEPEIGCQKLKTGSVICSVKIDLGKDDEGEPKGFGCSALVDRTPLPLGVLFKRALGERTVEEAPPVEVEATAQGTSARILVPSFEDHDGKTIFGTTKVAVTYGPGYSLTCEDNGAGGSAAFKRISTQFFASATFAKPAYAPLFRYAFKHRRGDSVLGFSFADVFKDEDGYSETHMSFSLEIEGKTWHVLDGQRFVERDGKGAVDSIRSVHWLEGQTPVVLSAKPGESGRMRIKLEAGDKHDSLELTPEAPLSTEVWEAPRLLSVSAGKAKTHRYGFLTVTDDGEPSIAYATLSRVKPGVVLEVIEDKAGGKKRKTSGDPPPQNEISVDERGLATKQVSADAIYERILVKGELASPAASAKGSKRRAP